MERVRWRAWLILMGLVGCLGLVGCKKDLLDELEGYGRVATQANPQIEAVSTVFQKVRQMPELVTLRSHLKEKVLPALQTYIKTLESLRLQHKDLAEAHDILVKAHQDWFRALSQFHQQATTDTLRMKWVSTLQKQAREYDAALRKYKSYMKLVYQAARRRL
ncbi:MAG: hypothetical protein EP343_17490 [Deltaproteobacteria bacterium]|nr:MAG: hypothetical protein EP343_17490 [Deltaproteobacteria bacterium]